ncbi:MAG TPA: winged helix-turn-helix domain-containing protein [Rhizomicrobium sp.]|nr:winged helix-turn-helix domain-containing protein [Rhizomicrobium sp.]
MDEQEKSAYRFADFQLQPAERRLLRGEEAIALTPKAFEILRLLVERAGHAVSKDEIMTTIWPDRFVAESNLTKHIWTLRQALGESQEGGRFIETVPKLGYRFVAPVTADGTTVERDASPSLDPPPVRISGSGWRRQFFSRASALFAALLFAAVAMTAWWLWNGRDPVFPWSRRAPGTAVAVFDFDNLSHKAADAWIGPAFSEMLGTEMAEGGQLHLLPSELIRQTRGDTTDPDAGGFSPETLAGLHRQLAVDYVVTGSFLASSKPGEQYVRLDLALQDARSGVTVATFSRTGPSGDLPSLVALAGADLRKNLDLKIQSADELRRIANARPPSADVMRHIGFALQALHRYEPARARDELLQAVAGAPDYAPSYVYLAKAWTALGYDQKALAASKQAVAHSAGLPQDMRLKIEAQKYEAQFQWMNAVASLRTLAAGETDNFETQLDIADDLLRAGKAKAAHETVAQLQQRGEPMVSDPRLELLDARIANAQGNTKDAAEHARLALHLAQARDAAGLTADAQTALGATLLESDRKSANAMLAQALTGYRRIANPGGAAEVHRLFGILFGQSQPKRAVQEFRDSLAQSQAIGDRNGMAAGYADLATALWDAGDRDGAEAATTNVLRIRRETGDIRGQAWALAALAIEQSDERASDESLTGFRQAAALDASVEAHGHRAFSLFSLADILRLRGEFVQAELACAEAQSEYRGINANLSGADLECAEISLDRGDLSTAEAGLDHVRQTAPHTQEPKMLLGNVATIQGQIAMSKGQWAEGARLFDGAKKEFAEADLKTGEAVATSLLALSYSALGKTAKREAAAKRAAELRSGMTERQEVIQVDIALTELRGETGNSAEAISRLQSMAADARARQWPGWALEAELAELNVLKKTGKTAQAVALRTRIAGEARQQGFGWVLQRVARL